LSITLSSDGTVDILEQFEDRCQVYYNNENIGFAAAQNQAIRLSSGGWVLTLIQTSCCCRTLFSVGGCRPVRSQIGPCAGSCSP